jgi:CubicO group peptidase (beta-lactamase class C family)
MVQVVRAFLSAALMLPGILCAAHAEPPPAVIFPGEMWQEVLPESQGMDPGLTRQAVAFIDSQFGPEAAQELVMIRRGRLIWKGPNIDACHDVWSCTKVFTSTVLGLLIADGRCRLDDLVVTHLPTLDNRYPLYAKARLRHLASMSSGYQGRVVEVTPEQPWGDPLAYLDATDPLFEPGTQVQYHDHQVFVLGAILTRLSGASLQAVFARRVADPIGLTTWGWGVSGTIDGIELNNAAGTPAKTPGVQITARQMARFGYLYLRRGNWNGRQILPADFVEEASRNQAPGAGASRFLHGRYGLYWWTNDVMPEGRRPWPAAPPRTYTAHGHSCNFCFVVPEWDMVIVRMGTSPIGAPAATDQLWDGFFARLARAFRDTAAPLPGTADRSGG